MPIFEGPIQKHGSFRLPRFGLPSFCAARLKEAILDRADELFGRDPNLLKPSDASPAGRRDPTPPQPPRTGPPARTLNHRGDTGPRQPTPILRTNTMSNDLVVQLGAKLDQFQSDMNQAGDKAMTSRVGPLVLRVSQDAGAAHAIDGDGLMTIEFPAEEKGVSKKLRLAARPNPGT